MVSIFNEDCLQVMEQLILESKKVDLIVTDPPYLMGYKSNRRKQKYEFIKNDLNSHDLIKDFIKKSFEVLKEDSHFYCFCSWHNVDFFKQEIEKLFKIKNILVWEKNNHGSGDLKGSYAPKYEFIIFATKGRKLLNGSRIADIVKFNKTGNEYHSTQKPVDLLQLLIEKSSNEGDTVLDPFMGSGSTGIACLNTKRSFIGAELDSNYFKVAFERIEAVKA